MPELKSFYGYPVVMLFMLFITIGIVVLFQKKRLAWKTHIGEEKENGPVNRGLYDGLANKLGKISPRGCLCCRGEG